MTKTRKLKRAASLPAWLGAWCLSRGVVMPLTEFRFDEVRRWRFDFCWPCDGRSSRGVALEINGGVWISGRHNRGRGYLKDLEKINAAQAAGWIIGQFATEQVAAAMDWLDVVFKTREGKQ